MPHRLVPALLIVTAIALAACAGGDGPATAAGPTSTATVNVSGILTCADRGSDPIKCSAPGWTLPPPQPCDHPLHTAEDIKGAVRATRSPGESIQLGPPLLVRSLLMGRHDRYLVPHVDGSGDPNWISVVDVAGPQRGCVGMASSWAGAFPRLTEDAARRRAGAAGERIATAEAVVLPFLRHSPLPLESEVDFVWRVVLASGTEVFVFSDGTVVMGAEVRSTVVSRYPGMPLRPRN
jgi:hypothetical protein